MSRINGAAGVSSPSTDASPDKRGANDLREVDMDQFLQLLIAEMQNQDPLNPMENSEILAQIGQIREISATNALSDTLGAVLTGQNLATASSLIGKDITALSDTQQEVKGTVDRVSVAAEGEDGKSRVLKVHVGSHTVDLNNIREIV
jgi:flagellar basal-body rod modification protein FlgD